MYDSVIVFAAAATNNIRNATNVFSGVFGNRSWGLRGLSPGMSSRTGCDGPSSGSNGASSAVSESELDAAEPQIRRDDDRAESERIVHFERDRRNGEMRK